MRRADPTQEELLRTWQRCRRPTWPASFGEAMADPLLSRLVRLNAMHPPRPHRKPEPLQRAPHTQPAPRTAHGYFDRKRAAAGDRDD